MSLGLLFVVTSLATGPGPVQPFGPQAVDARAVDEEGRGREDERYEEGTDALDEGAWDRAAAAFRSVADMKGRRADAALYWLAYARSRQGQRREALGIIDDLRHSHPRSRWLKEAKALELEIRQQSGQPARPESLVDEDLKLMALNGLLNTDPEQAIPLLEKFLKGQQSGKLQEQALFVLCQSGSPRAREIVMRIARGESNPGLQRKAIQSLGIFGGQESGQALAAIYSGSADPEVKKAVLEAFMVADEKGRVLEAARREADPQLRAHAMHMLGAMGAQDELWAMYQAETSRDAKKALLQSLGVSGAVGRVLEAARSEKDIEVRLDAIETLGPFGGPPAALVEIYRANGDRRVREAALQALFVQGDAKPLIEIARTETNPELKKKAVAHLATMRSKEATDFLLELLDK